MSGMNMQYIFACTGPGTYRVSKFEDGGDAPLEQYTVDATKPSAPCDCPAWGSGKTRPCKHGRMVQEYIKAGEPDLGDYRCIGRGKDWIFALNSRPKGE